MKKSFKIIFSTLLLISISWQCSAKTAIYFNFKFNQKKLALTICENKDKVNSCCKAKCVLDKEIKKQENSESNLPSSLKDKIEKSELFSGCLNFYSYQNSILQVLEFNYNPLFPTNISGSVFHPPTI